MHLGRHHIVRYRVDKLSHALWNGQQVLRALKNDPLTADIPVIILSSLSQQNEEKFKKNGAVGYFEKAKLIEDANSGKLHDAIRNAVLEARLLKRKSLFVSNNA